MPQPQVRLVLPSFRNASTALAVAVIAASVFWKVAYGAGVVLYLVPASVFSGEVWQLVTWLPAAAPETGSVLFSALILWSTGGSLEQLWGKPRFLRFVFITTALSGLATLLTALVIPGVGGSPYFGGNIMSAVVWVGYGCAIWSRSTNIFGYPVTGRTFAMLGVLLLSLNAVFSSWYLLIAEAWALAFTFAYARFGFPSEFLLRFRSWQLERDLKKRSSHLKGIDGGRRNVGGDSDKYLH
jgi:hypothetical protein